MKRHQSAQSLILGVGLCLLSATVLAQSVGAACSTSGQTFSLGANPAQILVCNGATWALAQQTNATGIIGVGQSSPQTILDINGGLRVGASSHFSGTCGASNAGELTYSTSGACSVGSPCIEFCNSTSWQSIASAPSLTVGCPQTGTYSGSQTQILNLSAGCFITFKAWGGGGAGGNYFATNSRNGGAGGAAGYGTITLGTSGSDVIYYLFVGDGGKAVSATSFGGGGVSLAAYTGGSGTFSGGGGGGGGASGVFTGGFGSTAVLIASGAGGGQSGVTAANGVAGSNGNISVGADLNSVSQGLTATGTQALGGGGGGHPLGGKVAVNVAYGGQCYAASGGVVVTSTLSANVAGPTGATTAGAGGTGGVFAGLVAPTNGTSGAIYWSSCTSLTGSVCP